MFRPLAEAMRFLTIIPFPGDPPGKASRTFIAYPLAGLLIGLGSTMIGAAFSLIAGSFFCAVSIIAARIIITGGLHYDGLADLADGFGGGRDRERRLSIMADSRLGSFGALAILITFSAQTAIVHELLTFWGEADSGLADAGENGRLILWNLSAFRVSSTCRRWGPYLILPFIPAVSRGILPAIITVFPSARPGGLGDRGRKNLSAGAASAAALFAAGPDDCGLRHQRSACCDGHGNTHVWPRRSGFPRPEWTHWRCIRIIG